MDSLDLVIQVSTKKESGPRRLEGGNGGSKAEGREKTCDICITGAYPRGYNEICTITQKIPKLDLTTDAVANLVNLDNAVVNVQQCSLLQGYRTLYLRNDISLLISYAAPL